MRILVIPHDMQLGGSSINALDLARTVRERGHDVWVMARPGPLRDRLPAFGLPLVEAPAEMRVRPSPAAVRTVRAAVRRLGIDVVHAYEYWPTLEAYLGAGRPGSRGAGGAATLGTIMSMGSLPPYIPPVPLTLGYGDLYDEVRAVRRHATLLEPPVDTADDRPDAPDLGLPEFRARFDLPAGPPTVAIVSRLARNMKQESIERTIDAVRALDPHVPDIRALVVGGGSAEDDLRRRADKVNADLGRRAVVMTGPLDDPRAAYACADVVCGMGSSILRGMAFAVACVVVGERGFTEPVRPETVPVFDRFGFYGVGEGLDPAADPLPGLLRELFDDTERRRELAAWSRALVVERVGLERQAELLVTCYESAIAARRERGALPRTTDALGTLGRTVGFKAAERVRAVRARSARGRGPQVQGSSNRDSPVQTQSAGARGKGPAGA
ncbi:MAG: glycosyltransferase [Streptomycetaceae bacterium]|nr:glycosyltransferase [Streptomycetaceae bacterium]